MSANWPRVVEGPGAPVIASIPDAANIYTATLAQNGSEMTVSLAGTGAKVGDTIHIQWGTSTFDQVLTAVNITSGSVTLNVPAAVTYSTASYNYAFAVTAQIVGKDGMIGAMSEPYDVVGTYNRALVSDGLRKAPDNNVYTGNGVTVTTTGTMAKTAQTAGSMAGLTLSDSQQANAIFTLTQPADQITLRLSGTDNALGAQIRVYDTNGKLMHEQMVFGDATARHLATFSWAKSGPADIGSFTVTAMSASVTLDSFSQYVVTHAKDARDPNLIDVLSDTFYGSDGSDMVTLSQASATYFAQAKAAIHGDSGTDTLKLLGANHALNLTTAGNKISSMERIDLTGSGNNTLTLNLSDVLRNGGLDLFYSGDKSRVQMMVTGNAGDSVYLSDLLTGGVDHGNWVQKTVVVIDGESFNSYQHSSLPVELLVKTALSVMVTNSKTVGEEGTLEAMSYVAKGGDVMNYSTYTYATGDGEVIAKLGSTDRLSGGAGSEAISSVGTGETVYAGPGDDVVRITSIDFAEVNGGPGMDTLVMDGQSMHLDLSVLGAKVQGFEKFDLGTGGNKLSLAVSDLLGAAAPDVLTANGRLQLVVNGHDGEVNLHGNGNDWMTGGVVSVGGVTYDVFSNLAGTAELLVEDGVQVWGMVLQVDDTYAAHCVGADFLAVQDQRLEAY